MDKAGREDKAGRLATTPRKTKQDVLLGQGARPKQSTKSCQDTCRYCHRQGHTVDQCLGRVTCEYCRGRYHTTQTCRERLADKRHQDLIEAVKIGRQETLALLKDFPLHPYNTWSSTLHPTQAAITRHLLPPQRVTFPTLYTPHHAFQSQQTAAQGL